MKIERLAANKKCTSTTNDVSYTMSDSYTI